MKRIIAIIVLSIVSVKCAFAQISSNFAPVHAHQAEMSLACATTMTNILKDIAKVAPDFPPLSGIGSVSIETLGSTDALTYCLYCVKNEHIEIPPPHTNTANAGQSFILRQRPYNVVIDSGGIDLQIVLFDRESSRGTKIEGKRYPLLTVNGWDKFALYYYVRLNAPDARLENTLSNIVETNVTLLRSNLQQILQVDPEREKHEVLAAVMTNILSKLKEIQPQYPLLSNINSATIETKGTNYLYQHLRYWEKASVASEPDGATNNSAVQKWPSSVWPGVDKGGMALDVYLLSRDEPFGFNPTGARGYPLITKNGEVKVELVYFINFNRNDVHSDAGPKMTLPTRNAIYKIMDDQDQATRRALDNVIQF